MDKRSTISGRRAGRETRAFFLLLALCTAAALPSCQKDAGPEPAPVSRVVVAYLGGDNNLSDEVAQKTAALAEGFARSAVAGDLLLVFSDTRGGEPELTEYAPDGRGGAQARQLHTYEGWGSADPQTLASVTARAQSLYPGAAFGLVIFSHASGWLPEGTYLNPLLPPSQASSGGSRSVIRDGDDEMELTELAGALPDGMFGWIVFETCFMAGVEVVYELRDKAPYIVASSAEIVSPGFTPLYPDAVGYLMDGDMEGFAGAAFALADGSAGWRRSATCSVIRTAGLQALKDFITANADFGTPVDVFDIQRFDRNQYRLFFDLQDYYGRLLATEAQRGELAQLVEQCVVWKAATPTFMEGHGGFDIERHSGLTAYIPQPEFTYLNEAYRRLAWKR